MFNSFYWKKKEKVLNMWWLTTIIEGFMNHHLHIKFKHQTLIQIDKLTIRWHSTHIESNSSLPTPDGLIGNTTQTGREEMPKTAKVIIIY